MARSRQTTIVLAVLFASGLSAVALLPCRKALGTLAVITMAGFLAVTWFLNG